MDDDDQRECIRQIVLPAIIPPESGKIILPVVIVLQSIDISSNSHSTLMIIIPNKYVIIAIIRMLIINNCNHHIQQRIKRVHLICNVM